MAWASSIWKLRTGIIVVGTFSDVSRCDATTGSRALCLAFFVATGIAGTGRALFFVGLNQENPWRSKIRILFAVMDVVSPIVYSRC